MKPLPEIDAYTVQRVAALNGLMLSLEGAAELVPGLRAILAVDSEIAALDLGPLPATGLPWEEDVADAGD